MKHFSFNTKHTKKFFTESEYIAYSPLVSSIHENKLSSSEKGDAVGWLDYTLNFPIETLTHIQNLAVEIQQEANVFVVIGIGGSYLGSRAVTDALSDYFPFKNKTPEILYIGNNLSGTYLHQLLRYLEDKSVYVNIVSKSGSTTEPAIAFRILKQFMERKYGVNANKRIIATTDSTKGILKKIAEKEDYRQFTIPQNIGGRYSIFTSVGLLPIAVAGLSIEQLLAGVNQAIEDFSKPSLSANHAYQYAVTRNLLYQKGYAVELFTAFEPSLKYFQEWLKQLFGESEGKDLKGIFPADVSYPTDLHSFGQYVQDGKRQLFETMVSFQNLKEDLHVPSVEDDVDHLNYLAQNTLNEINQIARKGTILAHTGGNVPIFEIELPTLDEFHLGYTMFFFMKACAMSAYLLGVNPFDQPGVEAYKQNMFKLLGKFNTMTKLT